MKTIMARPATVEKKWYIIDAEGKALGRVASEVATLLRGKHKPTFTPNVDCGDNVIVLNSDKIVLTGKKTEQKYFKRYSGFTSGLKLIQYKKMMEEHSDVALMRAIKGMLPKNTLGRTMAKHCLIYKGAEHKNQAQKPEVWNGGKN
ncbi:MAG: 50S ribosomal protein L13 [Clostridiales bacterium]|nr:50S ribosomal protein L13 [Clostridiales bacterium]